MNPDFKFKPEHLTYTLTQVSDKPANIRDEDALHAISQVQDPLTQAHDILTKKPFNRYNASVAFILCQFIVERKDPKNGAREVDGLVKQYAQAIKLLNKL